MKYGAKNQLAGTVTKIKRGTVMSQVNLEIKAAFNNSVEHVFHFHTLNFTPITSKQYALLRQAQLDAPPPFLRIEAKSLVML